jgi:hypothetical protein
MDAMHSPRTARDLPTLTRLHLHVVNDGADRNVGQRHGISRLHVDLLARDHGIADLQALRGQDVAQLAILVLDKRDEGGAVGVVLQPLDLGRHVELQTLEIDHPIAPLVPAATPPGGDPPRIVAPALLGQALGQRFYRLALP